MSKPGRLREVMPDTAAFIDAMRAAFGREAIDDQIAAGMAGRPGFHAIENGQEIGTAGFQETPGGPIVQWDPARAVKLGDMVLGEANVKKGKRDGKA